MTTEALRLAHELVVATRAALACATRLDGAGLDHANQARSDVLFSLRVALEEGVSESERAELRPLFQELSDVEDRLERVALEVLAVMDGLNGRSATKTYTASGRVAAG